MIVSPVPDFKQVENNFLTYMSLHCTVMNQLLNEMSNQVQEIESLAAVSKKYVKIPGTSDTSSYIGLTRDH